MKFIHTLAAGLLLAGLASCEMKEELLGGEKNYTNLGFLDLGVAVNASQNVVTKAEDDGGVSDDGITGGSQVSADDFPVSITGTVAEDGEDYSKNFESYEALQNENPVELPVGTYTITAHSNLELVDQMSEPYYEGSAEKISITKDVTSEAKVICKMKNTKIQMVYPTDFIEAFDSWTITISDGVGKILTFTHEDLNPKAVYWLISAEQKTLTVEIEAKNSDGETIHDSRVLEKPEGGNSDFWTGGDALTITMKPQADSGEPTGSSIGISVDITFDETSETIPVPVTPGTGTEEPDPSPEPGPDEPGDDDSGLSMTLPGVKGNITYTLDGSDMPAEANVVISAPKGMKSLVVKIKGGNDEFTKTLGDLNTGGEMSLDFIDKGVEMVDNSIISSVLAAFLQGQTINAPAANETSYSFPIHAFFTLMNEFGATAPNSHVFTMTLEDNEGNKKEESLSVTINPAE